jgi:hypothetical protein
MHREKMAKSILLFDHVKISTSEMSAGLAAATLFKRSEVKSISFVANLYLSLRCKCSPKTGCASWEYTVKHIYTKGYSESKINRVSYTHQISWLAWWKYITALPHCPKEILFSFPTRESSNCITRSIDLHQLL